MTSAPSGVRLAGLSTKGQPAAIAGATLCAARFNGKLKGVMKEQGPTGTRRVKPRVFAERGALSRGSTSPAMRSASPAAMRKVSMRRATSPRESRMGLPASMHSMSASSSERAVKAATQ